MTDPDSVEITISCVNLFDYQLGDVWVKLKLNCFISLLCFHYTNNGVALLSVWIERNGLYKLFLDKLV